MSLRIWPLLIVLSLVLSSCTSTPYLWQAAQGQLSLLGKARPIAAVIDDPATPAEVRRKLQLAAQVRQWAVSELGFPDHGTYLTYSDLGRPYVVWNVFSAPELSITLRTRCFPVAGCVSYQGFFQEAAAQKEAESRRQQGDDVLVGGVSAYSTLGHFQDPVLSSMLSRSDTWLVRTLLHEMAHPSLYVAGDTAFNESYAVTLENEGMRRWLSKYGTPELAQQDAAEQQRAAQWQAFLLGARARLSEVYAQPLSDDQKRQRKAAILDEVQQQEWALRREWFGNQPLPPRQSNASLGAVAAYADLLPDFQHLLARVNGDLAAFMREASVCAKRPPAQRAECLRR